MSPKPEKVVVVLNERAFRRIDPIKGKMSQEDKIKQVKAMREKMAAGK